MNKTTCFVIMPFGGSDKAVHFHWDLVYEKVICPAFEVAKAEYSKTAPAQDIRIVRIDEKYVAEALKESIVSQLNEAPVIVADVSDNNPNVLFELGFRYAHGKPIVCISEEPETTAFWGTTFSIIDYTLPTSQKLIADGILHGLQKARTRTDEALESLQATIGKPDPRDSFQDRVVAWRLAVAKDQIKSVQSGDWSVQLRPNAAYMHHVLEGAAALLQKGEKYRSLTNGEFWLSKVDSLLNANITAAKDGVLIERIFVLTKSEFEDARKNPKGNLRRALNDQIDAAKEAVEATNNDQSFVVKAQIIEDGQPKGENFALLYDADGVPRLALAPKMENGKFTDLRFDFLLGSKDDKRKTGRWVNALSKASGKGTPLAELLRSKKPSRRPS
jgi:hypothetical protein